MANDNQKQYKRNRAIAFVLASILHIGFIVALAYTMIHSTIQNQEQELGIEMNFGVDDTGEGLTQNSKDETPSETLENEESESDELSDEELQEAMEEFEESEQITQDDAAENEEVAQEELISENVENSESDVTASDDIITEESASENVQTEQPSQEETSPTVDENSLLVPSSSGNKEGENSKENVNQGNVEGATGDQGNEKGEINADALLNSSGGKGGSNLDMPGWMWMDKPKVSDSSSETGKVIFDITIDDVGEVISVKTVTSTVSKSTEQKYKEAVYQLLFEPTDQDADVNSTTSGRITFIITTK
ncbi:hypothetical protein [Sediminitomix flava]|uniref:TonB family protein n=1 Tax=Sediminitomix flava TaxID=379075 RepID=A0A315ZAW3_SEDFL|nr:hypothetical protein [Sediminitomix flava]PWJ42289.1 hypothetical protein BC781_103541 [Sediminitomix flava]